MKAKKGVTFVYVSQRQGEKTSCKTLNVEMEKLAEKADEGTYNPNDIIPVENLSCTKEESDRIQNQQLNLF